MQTVEYKGLAKSDADAADGASRRTPGYVVVGGETFHLNEKREATDDIAKRAKAAGDDLGLDITVTKAQGTGSGTTSS